MTSVLNTENKKTDESGKYPYFYNHCKYSQIFSFRFVHSVSLSLTLTAVHISEKGFIRVHAFCKEYENLMARELVQKVRCLTFLQLVLIQSLDSTNSTSPFLQNGDTFTEMSFEHDWILMQQIFVECIMVVWAN